jgi:hypothetical protein
MVEKECGIKEFMSLTPQAFHLIFRNAWGSVDKLSYIKHVGTHIFLPL